jgi:SSS family solute:Na+ symporter
MNVLIRFVVLYWVISVAIGLYAAKYVRNSRDYAVTGRSLPVSVVTAMVFATGLAGKRCSAFHRPF